MRMTRRSQQQAVRMGETSDPGVDAPIYKLVNRQWKVLSREGDDVFIRDARLREGSLGDLTKKTAAQLEEALQRQDRALANRPLLSKLRDKGASLHRRREEVFVALQAVRERERQQQEDARHLPTDSTSLEWKANGRVLGATNECDRLDSDDDDDEDEGGDRLDPLKLMAYHSSCVKKPPAHIRPSQETDPVADIEQELKHLELEEVSQPADSCDFGAKRNQMLEEKQRRNRPTRDSFKPFRPVKHPQPIPGLSHCTTTKPENHVICISQQESVKLEHQYIIKEKERLFRDGMRKVAGHENMSSASFGSYRDTNMERHLLESEEEWEEEEGHQLYHNSLSCEP